MKLNQIIEQLAIISPEVFAEDWDNGGIQIDTGIVDIKNILIALEITDDVVDEAIKKNMDMIITHHPFVFKPLKSIENDWIGKNIVKLIQNKITVYTCHTSFDSVIGGNNDYLADLIGLNLTETIDTLDNLDEVSGAIAGLGRIGEFDRIMTLEEVCILIKNKLDINHPMNYVGLPNDKIKRVAICTGSGSDFIDDAYKKDCQLLITGDVKYHDAQNAKQLGLALIDGTHFHTEKIFTKNMYEQLKNVIGNQVDIFESEININPFNVI